MCRNFHHSLVVRGMPTLKGRYTLVTLPRIVILYCDTVDETCACVTYQKLVTR